MTKQGAKKNFRQFFFCFLKTFDEKVFLRIVVFKVYYFFNKFSCFQYLIKLFFTVQSLSHSKTLKIIFRDLLYCYSINNFVIEIKIITFLQNWWQKLFYSNEKYKLGITLFLIFCLRLKFQIWDGSKTFCVDEKNYNLTVCCCYVVK